MSAGMIDQNQVSAEAPHSLHPYVSDRALAVLSSHVDSGWTEIDGSLAFFDITGFTKLSERLAALGRSGAEHINDVLNTVFKGLIEEVFHSEGDVLEFGGDAMVVLFSGDHHQRRAAIATARMFRFMRDNGRIITPAGGIRLQMSCGIASGPQAYHLLGSTRRALVVAGPVSTKMAELEAVAGAGEARIDDALAAALPTSWVDRTSDATLRLRLGRVATDDPPAVWPVRQSLDGAIAKLLPTQFHSLVDVRHRAGELKQVAMSFIRLDGTDDMLMSDGVADLHQRLSEITDIVDLAAAELDVCWLETQAEANSVRWTLIAGAPTATEHDGERLLRVLRRIADQTPLPLRIGANLGVVFVGDMGHPQRCTFIVMGDATNLAARLMARAAPGEIIAGERLVETCPDRFENTPLEPFLVKGKRAPVRAFLIGQVDEIDAALDGSADSTLAMVGRDAELKRLRAVINANGIADIVGVAGSGKTRLWHQARILESERRWLVTRAEPHETGSPYLPFRRLIRPLAGIGPRDDGRTAGMLMSAFVERVAPGIAPWLPLIADVIGAEVETTTEVEALDPTFRGDRLRIAAADLLLAVAGHDAVIVFEDVHWIDDASRALLEVLTRVLAKHAATVVTRRPGGWSPPSVTTIDLAPISGDFANQVLLRELPARAASDATLSRLRGAAAGNPLYLIELARSVATAASPSTTAYPETVERVLDARIDQLPIVGRELIRDVAVLGSTINRALASRVLERPELVNAETWRRELGDLIIVDEDTVRFRHDLVRVAAYEGLSVRRRRALHQRAGDVIEAWGLSVPLPDPVAALAFHASGSGMPDRVIRWNRQAAEAAIAKGAMETAESLLRDVVSALRELGAAPEECRAAYRRLAFVAERAGHPEASLDALSAAARSADERERCVIAVDRARMQEILGQYSAALATTARAIKVCPDELVAGHLRLSRANIHNFQGRWNECLDVCRSLLEDFAGSDDARLLARAHVLAEWCCTCLGLPERADHEQSALRILTELDDSIGLGNLFLSRGISAWQECRAPDALAHFRTSSEHYRRAGDVLGTALADNNVAEILTLQFRLDAAEALLVPARRVTQAANYPHGTMTTISGLSRVAAWRGHIAEALDLQEQALRGFRDLRAADLVADSLVRLAEVHVIAGDAPAALATVKKARDALADLRDVPVLPATIARLEARALLLSGRQPEARRLFETAFALATADEFTYEIALASLGLARIDGDEPRAAEALAQLSELGVLAPPPGS
jgi:class 3 adenylate cyclase/tetratricopeptide (TPR) repeat protein